MNKSGNQLNQKGRGEGNLKTDPDSFRPGLLPVLPAFLIMHPNKLSLCLSQFEVGSLFLTTVNILTNVNNPELQQSTLVSANDKAERYRPWIFGGDRKLELSQILSIQCHGKRGSEKNYGKLSPASSKYTPV